MSGQVQTDYNPGGAPFTGRKALIAIVLFFAVIIAANMTMLTAAVGSFGGLVTDSSHVAGRTFEEDQAARRALPITGWTVEVADVSSDVEASFFSLRIVDAHGAPVEGVLLSAQIGRPTHGRDDREATFTETAPGLYRVDAAVPHGVWRVRLIASDAADAAEPQTRTVRILIRAPRSVE